MLKIKNFDIFDNWRVVKITVTSYHLLIIEIIIHKISLRRAVNVTQDRLEVDYQGGEEPSLSVVKTVLDMEQEEKDKSELNACVEEGKDY